MTPDDKEPESIAIDVSVSDRILDGIVEDIAGAIRSETKSNELGLSSAYRPITSHIRRSVSSASRSIDRISSVLRVGDTPTRDTNVDSVTDTIVDGGEQLVYDSNDNTDSVVGDAVRRVSDSVDIVGDIARRVAEIMTTTRSDSVLYPQTPSGPGGPVAETDLDRPTGRPTPDASPPKPGIPDATSAKPIDIPSPIDTGDGTCPAPEPQPICIYPDGTISTPSKSKNPPTEEDKIGDDKPQEDYPEPPSPPVGIGEDDITSPTPTAPIISPIIPTGLPYCGRDPKPALDAALADGHKYVEGDTAPSYASATALSIVQAVTSAGQHLLSYVSGPEVSARAKAQAIDIGADILAGVEIFRSLYGAQYISGYGSPVGSVYYAAKYGIARKHAQDTRFPIDYYATADMYVMQYASPVYIPSQSEIDDAWVYGAISDSQWETWTRCNGNIPQCRLPILASKNYRHTARDIVDLYRRGVISDLNQYVSRLAESGIRGEKFAREIYELSTVLPSPSELVHWAVRDVFDPAKLGREEMMREYRQQRGLQEMFDIIGYSDRTYTLPDGRKVEYKPGLYTFMASYEEVSPTQVYEMMHRLRPGRTHLYALPTGGGGSVTPEPVDIHTVRKLLKEKDYNPIWRDRLAAISYRPLGRIELKRIYSVGGFGRPQYIAGYILRDGVPVDVVGVAEREMVERFMDYGYTRGDSLLLAYHTSHTLQSSSLTQATKRRIKDITTRYTLGLIGKEIARQQLTTIVGDASRASDILDAHIRESETQAARKRISYVRRAYITGGIDDDELRRSLVDIGMIPSAIQTLLDDVREERRHKRRHVVNSVLCQWYVTGQMTYEEYMTRLLRMGYDRVDAKRIIDTCLVGHAAKSAREQRVIAEKTERAQKQRERAKERIRQRVIRTQQQTVDDAYSLRTPATLQRWLRTGLIDADSVRDTLRRRGVDAMDIERFIADALREQ